MLCTVYLLLCFQFACAIDWCLDLLLVAGCCASASDLLFGLGYCWLGMTIEVLVVCGVLVLVGQL